MTIIMKTIRPIIATGFLVGVLATAPAQAIVYRVTAADRDPSVARYGGGHAFWLPDNHQRKNIPNGNSSKFLFVNDSGRLNVSDDMTSARLTGTIQAQGDPASTWNADIMFILGMDYNTYAKGHTDPKGGTHRGKAKRELKHNQYTDHGGTIDPGTWRYFYMDESQATLTGADDGAYGGVMLDLFQRPNGHNYGKYVFQLGKGANGKNLGMGFSGWLGYTTRDTGDKDEDDDNRPHRSEHGQREGYAGIGDINVGLNPIPEPISAGLTLMGLGALTVATRRRRA